MTEETPREFKEDGNGFARGETPKFPLKLFGKCWHTGWDIPSYWAIDADNVPYADYGAHGCSMTKTTFEELINHLEGAGDSVATEVRALVGRKPALPGWARTALQQDWTPNENFKFEDYEGGEELRAQLFSFKVAQPTKKIPAHLWPAPPQPTGTIEFRGDDDGEPD